MKNMIGIIVMTMVLSCSYLFGQEIQKVKITLPEDKTRIEMNFNDGWRFHKGDVSDGWKVGYDDSSWRVLTLPHDWSVEGPFSGEWASGTGYLPGGIGWYRKSFEVAKGLNGRRVVLYFDGVYKNSEVWINGKQYGKRPNGYIAFEYDVTDAIAFGKENVIAVKVDHTDFADSRWYTGSGIYRDVTIKYLNPVHVGQWGVQAEVVKLDRSKAVVKITTELVNHNSSEKTIVLRHQVSDGNVNWAGKYNSDAIDVASGKKEIACRIELPKPILWSVDRPHLYRVYTDVYEGGKVSDRVVTVFGIRETRFDPDKGFFLNGEPMKLKGVCFHHDAGTLGAAVPKDVWRRRLGILKELGCNAIRLSHNPAATDVYDLCDEMGFLVIDEAFDEWEGAKNKWVGGWNVGKPSHAGYNVDFKKWAKIDLRDQVRKNRNHPCIIMWSIGNEVDYPNDPYSHPVLNEGRNPQIYGRGYDPKAPNAERLGEIARKLAAVVKANDTTRPVTAGLASAAISNEVGYADALDVVGYNYQEYRYEEDHKKYPKRPLYGSENGMSLDAWKAVTDHEFIMGQFLWTGIEYLGEAGRFPRRHSTSGLMDLAGNKKPEFYFRQSLWSEVPMVYVGSAKPRDGQGRQSFWSHKRADERWNWRDGEEVELRCFSNCPEVELFLNGESLGRKTMAEADDRILRWRTPFEAGEVVAVGLNREGEKVCEFKLQTAGEAKKLAMQVEGLEAGIKAGQVLFARVDIVDGDGVRVWNATNRITCTVEGAGHLLGLEDSNPNNVEDYRDHSQDSYQGRLLAYIQTGDAGGDCTIRFSSEGLEDTTFTVSVQK